MTLLDSLPEPLPELLQETLNMETSFAEFADAAAERLRQGDSPYRIAHYLEQLAGKIKESRARLFEALQTEWNGTHEVDVHPQLLDDITGARAVCSCGWRGNWRLAEQFACEEALTHKRERNAGAE